MRMIHRLAPAALLVGLAACQGTGGSTTATSTTATTNKPAANAGAAPAPVELTNELTATSQVTAVDKATRVVTLRREDGNLFQVLCGSDVRNFDQIAAGDTLRVKFKESLKVSLTPPGAGGPDAAAGVVAARAPVGATPAAAAGIGVSVRVKIESIDKEHGIVVFSLPSGELISHRIQTEDGHKFVEALKIGDKVQLDYHQAFALAIEKV
jgi:hypothetical protein